MRGLKDKVTIVALGGKRGVRCNSVAPGLTLTQAALENLTDEYRAEVLSTSSSEQFMPREGSTSFVPSAPRLPDRAGQQRSGGSVPVRGLVWVARRRLAPRPAA